MLHFLMADADWMSSILFLISLVLVHAAQKVLNIQMPVYGKLGPIFRGDRSWIKDKTDLFIEQVLFLGPVIVNLE